MTQTLTTKVLNDFITGQGYGVAPSAVEAMARELLANREAAETPSCWEIAGQLFTTKEEALKPGYRGTPEPLYDGPVLTDDREAQAVAAVPKTIPKSVYDVIYAECNGFVDCGADPQKIWNACRAAMLKTNR